MSDDLIKERMSKAIDNMRVRAKGTPTLEAEARDVFKVPNIVDVKVEVPLIKNGRPFFNLNKRFIEKAKREGKMMRISWPDGSAMHSPSDWLKNGEPYQKSFKFPDNPMEMIGSYLDLEE